MARDVVEAAAAADGRHHHKAVVAADGGGGGGAGTAALVWDCGSALYDSYELTSFRRQLDAAVLSCGGRSLSMPHLLSSSSTQQQQMPAGPEEEEEAAAAGDAPEAVREGAAPAEVPRGVEGGEGWLPIGATLIACTYLPIELLSSQDIERHPDILDASRKRISYGSTIHVQLQFHV
ncbi:hypothetical protein OsJ_21534 [Oryza sativa Japonica Group]|uniref:Uncharacterized protein n=1 Tax=Oryza sativa subsp. japonica TaxID=39947 RepID=B9FTJ4_ORYSJ|nr:hypothetical protein OsJ_21534 [Oryza sativa Japonica Group]